MAEDSFSLADELLHQQDDPYVMEHEIALDDLDQAERASTLDTAIDSIASSFDAVSNSETFDALRSFLKYYTSLTSQSQHKLLDAVSSGLAATLDATAREEHSDDSSAFPALAPTLERYAFLLQWFVSVAEKHNGAGREGAVGATPAAPAKGRRGAKSTGSKSTGGKDSWEWSAAIPGVLALMSKALRVRSERMWTVSAARDSFVGGCIMRPSLILLENEAYLKVPAIKFGIFKIVCQAVKAHGQAFNAQMSVIQSLQYYEHLAEPCAELLALMRIEFDYERLGEDVLREVAAKNFGALDTKSPRSFGRFLVRIAELSPRSVLKQISLLQKHLDSESYPMRNAMTEVIGLLIKELTSTDDAISVPSSAGSGSSAGGDGEGADAARGSVEARKRQVEGFFDLLFERFLDINSYVRSKLISVCGRLCELPTKFPKQRTALTDLVVRALEDKSSSVRKQAIGLLTKLILTHPYGLMHGGELSIEDWTARYERVSKQLDEVEGVLDLPGEGAEEDQDIQKAEKPEDEEENSGDDEEEDEDGTPKAKPKKRAPRKSVDLEALAASQAQMTSVDTEAVVKLRLTKRYYADALAFINQLEGAMPVLSQLLVSTNKAEVLESMEFFRVAYEYRLAGASDGIRKMVHLIWTKDNALVLEDGRELKGVRSRLIEVYRALYFDAVPDLSAKDNVARIARNMIERTFGATLAELTSLEQLLSTLAAENLVHADVVTKLWAVYAAPRAIPRAQRRGAIIVLSMLAVARREIVSERIDTLLRIGLGPLGARDAVLAKYTCIALQRVSGSVKKVKGALEDESVRYPMAHPMFGRLRAALQGPCTSGEWFALAEHAIQTIYLLGEQPDALAADIVKSMTMRVFGPKAPATAPGPAPSNAEEKQPGTDAAEDDADGSSAPASESAEVESSRATPAPTSAPEPAELEKGDAFELAQLLFVVGHVALKQIVYLELVEREYKRRKAVAEKEKLKAKGATDKAAAEELDQVAGSAEDEIGDVIVSIREKELLYGPHSLLSLFGPMVVHICSSPKSYPNDFLRKAAVLTLCKFMCVSSQFCEDNLGLLLHILSTSSDAVVRSNVVIALGDIAICFGTLVDENSDRLYAGLGDADLGVKKHTLMVLTHLILNGMIKVKGQLGEMAKCLEDDEPRVSDLAKLFFSELATKENAVYNNLPDIISHLSIGKHAVDEETFARTMKFIFTFIDKEKQAENVVEKLCQRFRLASEERQWRDIAFCLSLLPFKSERSMKKLIEGLPFYQDKLHNAEVFKRFSEILAKARGNKTASKFDSDLKEFEDILENFKSKGEQDAAFEGATQAKIARAEKRQMRGKGTRTRASRASATPEA